MTKHDTRHNILTAASQVVVRDGITQLTLEAVAQEAGISKGGLLYHFPNKDALIKGMVEHYLATFEERIATAGGSWLQAYIKASFAADPQENKLAAALLAAAALNPELLSPMQERYRQWQEKAGQIDPLMGTVIRLALDGLWVDELLGLAPPDEELRVRLLDYLLKLAEGL